jgi:SOS regulatory protein LexA
MNDASYLFTLRTFYRTHGRMPSYGELGALLKFRSKNAVTYHVDKWVEQGLVGKDKKTGQLLPGRGMSMLKILGHVRAGFPSPAEEALTEAISLDDWLISNKEASFMLEVIGDSMIDAGIHEGDVVILERGRQPKNGDIVVAEVDHDWTIKFFEKRNGGVVLKPANKKYKPIIPEEELKIAGVVTAVIRKYKR